MKKIKYLPLFGAALLALTSCGGTKELTKAQADNLYNETTASAYVVDGTPTPAIDKIYVQEKDPGTSGDLCYAAFADNMLVHMKHYQESAVYNVSTCFFNHDDDNTIALANVFNEDITYTLESKELITHFTGSVTLGAEPNRYSFAMYFTSTFDSVGLFKKSSFNAVVVDEEDPMSGRQTIIKINGSINVNWKLA